MSARKFIIAFSKLAQADVDDIMLYTLQNFGKIQFVRYQSVLEEAFKLLQEYPNCGANFSDKARVLRAGEHSIFYRVKTQKIFIIRILHQRMNVKNHL